MSLSCLLYIANLLVILSFLLHLCTVSRTADHVTSDTVSSVAGEFYSPPDTWTLSCPVPSLVAWRGVCGNEGDENLMSEAKIIHCTKGLEPLLCADANPFRFSDSDFLADLDGFQGEPVGPSGPSRIWQFLAFFLKKSGVN